MNPELKSIFDAELAKMPGVLDDALRRSTNPVIRLAVRDASLGSIDSFALLDRRALEGPPICMEQWRNLDSKKRQSDKVTNLFVSNYLHIVRDMYLDAVRGAPFVTKPEQLQIPNEAVSVGICDAPLYYINQNDSDPINEWVSHDLYGAVLNPALEGARFFDRLYLAPGWLTDQRPYDAPFGKWSFFELPREGGPDVTWCVFCVEFLSQCSIDFSKIARIRLPIEQV